MIQRKRNKRRVPTALLASVLAVCLPTLILATFEYGTWEHHQGGGIHQVQWVNSSQSTVTDDYTAWDGWFEGGDEEGQRYDYQRFIGDFWSSSHWIKLIGKFDAVSGDYEWEDVDVWCDDGDPPFWEFYDTFDEEAQWSQQYGGHGSLNTPHNLTYVTWSFSTLPQGVPGNDTPAKAAIDLVATADLGELPAPDPPESSGNNDYNPFWTTNAPWQFKVEIYADDDWLSIDLANFNYLKDNWSPGCDKLCAHAFGGRTDAKAYDDSEPRRDFTAWISDEDDDDWVTRDGVTITWAGNGAVDKFNWVSTGPKRGDVLVLSGDAVGAHHLTVTSAPDGSKEDVYILSHNAYNENEWDYLLLSKIMGSAPPREEYSDLTDEEYDTIVHYERQE